ASSPERRNCGRAFQPSGSRSVSNLSRRTESADAAPSPRPTSLRGRGLRTDAAHTPFPLEGGGYGDLAPKGPGRSWMGATRETPNGKELRPRTPPLPCASDTGKGRRDMSTELPKTFDPAAIEAKWYAHWENRGLFRPERPDAQPFTIVNPPPNVTGSLHIGHALDNTLQDVVVRYERLKGKDALWVVGTDHAGIATQMVVERELEKRQDKRTNYSREEFVAKVWEWKAQSGGQITRQLRRLGCSMDWSREQFTMDPHFTRAVVKVFVDLYNEGLIYRDKRLVNWDPKLKTATSDLEVETRDVQSGFWHFRYPLADGVTLPSGANHIVVATTRPETMLADMAVAVHPDDPRYASVIGKDILQPITNRRFKVIADEHADPE